MKNLLLLVLAVFIVACESGTDKKVINDPALYGVIVDSKGKPVADADIYIRYGMPSAPSGGIIEKKETLDTVIVIDSVPDYYIHSYPNPANSYLQVEFSLLREADATLKFMSLADDKVMMVLVDEILNAGTYCNMHEPRSMEDTMKYCPQGLYYYLLETSDTTISSKDNPLMLYDKNDCTGYMPHAKSGSDGSFKIEYPLFYIGTELERIAETGQVLGRYYLSNHADLEVYKFEGDSVYRAFYSLIIADENKAQDVKITVEKIPW